MTRFFTTFLYLLSLCFFGGMLGALGSQSTHIIGSSLILAVLLIDNLSWLGSFRNRVLVQKSRAIMMSVVALVTLILGQRPEVWLASACLLAFGLSAGCDDQASSRWMVLGMTTGLYLGLVIVPGGLSGSCLNEGEAAHRY